MILFYNNDISSSMLRYVCLMAQATWPCAWRYDSVLICTAYGSICNIPGSYLDMLRKARSVQKNRHLHQQFWTTVTANVIWKLCSNIMFYLYYSLLGWIKLFMHSFLKSDVIHILWLLLSEEIVRSSHAEANASALVVELMRAHALNLTALSKRSGVESSKGQNFSYIII